MMESTSASTACARCGHPVPSDDRFCMQCGTAVSTPAPAPIRPRRTWMYVAFGTLAVLLLGGLAGWWFFLRPYIGAISVSTSRPEVYASDIINGSVEVVRPNSRTRVTAQWMKDGRALHTHNLGFVKSEQSRAVSLEFRPDRPLEPGDYSLWVTAGSGRPVEQRFQVKADPPVQVDRIFVSNEGTSSGYSVAATSKSITVSGSFRDVTRFTRLRLVWTAAGRTLKIDEYAPSELDLKAGTFPFSSSLIGSGRPFESGSYTVKIYEGNRLVGQSAFSVYWDVSVVSIRVGTEVNSDHAVVTPVTSFTRPHTIWASFRIVNAPASTQFSVEWWRNGARERLSNGEQTWILPSDTMGVYQARAIINSDGLPPGKWDVVVKANGKELGRTTFTVK